MGIDLSVNLGEILTAASVLLGGTVFLVRLEGKLNVLAVERKLELQQNSSKFEAIEKQLEKLTECTVELAKQEQKISAIEDRILALSNNLCTKCQAFSLKKEPQRRSKT